MIVVLMGVSGCGKTTVGRGLAARLGWDYIEGDEWHPVENVEKMRSGRPLTDEDRWPWLERLSSELARRQRLARGVVLSCSALRREYRRRLAAVSVDPLFVHLTAPRDVIARRLAAREGHYMPATLLESQLETLEHLEADERCLEVPVTGHPGEIVTRLVSGLREQFGIESRP
jgi:gluconokinase